MRTGVLGGTFDPIHKGHLALAEAALQQLKLDRIIFVPAYRHPLDQKGNLVVASPEDRLAMTKLSIHTHPSFEVSDGEIRRKGISYTVDTLRALKAEFPKDEFYFITGGDWGKNLDQWKDIKTIFSLAHFVVAKRAGFDTSQLPKEVMFLDFEPLPISSTEIRKSIKSGHFSESLVPEEALQYIMNRQLYR